MPWVGGTSGQPRVGGNAMRVSPWVEMSSKIAVFVVVGDHRFRLYRREGLCAGLCGPTASLSLAGLAWVWLATGSEDDIF
jgi:hypothetical protein